MIDDNIEKLRRDSISNIKEKIKKNLNFLHPCNKDRLEYQKLLKFKSGHDFTYWMQNNGIMKNPTNIDNEYEEKMAIVLGLESHTEYNRWRHRNTLKNANCKNSREYQNKCANKLNFRDNAERVRNYRHKNGIKIPINECEENDWSAYFGNKTEELFKEFLLTIFEHVERMHNSNKGFDFRCKNPKQEFITKYSYLKLDKEKEYRIQLKIRCLDRFNNVSRWSYKIGYNNMADMFILVGFDSKENLNPLHICLF